MHFEIKDFGNGIENIEEALKIGSKFNQQTALNEHGYGLKHALAASDPRNCTWKIYTRTREDCLENQYKYMSAPYDFFDFKIFFKDGNCFNNSDTGTLIQFDCSKEWFNSVLNDFKNKNYDFENILDILKEKLGVYYSNIIEDEKIEMVIIGIDKLLDTYYTKKVTSIFPKIDTYINDMECNDSQISGKQSVLYDLGNDEITLEYYFALIENHDETQHYYKKNMESSGIEIRMNGRFIEQMPFKEVWEKAGHPSQNGLLIWINLVSNDKDRLPSTRTTKVGLNKSDPKLSKVKDWLKDKVSNMTQLKNALIKEEKLKCLLKSQIDIEYYKEYTLYKEEVQQYGRLLEAIYQNDKLETELYFLCESKSTKKDLYNIECCYDNFIEKGYSIKTVYFFAKYHCPAVVNRVQLINSKMFNGHFYNIQLETLEENEQYDDI